MKIAVPTDNKIVVCNNPRESGYFKIVTFRGKEIVNEEFRNNPCAGGSSGSCLTGRETDLLVTLLADCDVLIGGTCKNDFCSSRISSVIDTTITNRPIITSAVIEYNNRYLKQESNTCCSP